MSIKDIFILSIDSLLAHKLRSMLTTLGIIIGVITVITMQTFVSGLNNHIVKELALIGPNTFYVQKDPVVKTNASKYKNRKNVTMAQAHAIAEKANLVSTVAPESFKSMAIIRFGRRKTNPDVLLVGGTDKWQLSNGFFVEEGRFITPIDLAHNRTVCVLGLAVVEKLFPFQDPLGEQIMIDGNRFSVAGILEEKGNFIGQDRDNIVVIPISSFQKIYGKKRSLLIVIKSKSPELLPEAMDEVSSILRIERGVPPGNPSDFEVLTRDSLMEVWRSLTHVVFATAVGICLISLLIGGIGVMNIMLVSVTKRTREIGIRKAVGARQKDILLQFLIEATLVCQLGGLTGAFLGICLGKLIGSMTSLPTAVPVWSIVLGFGFVLVVGLFFGIYPATKAARMLPVQALRCE